MDKMRGNRVADQFDLNKIEAFLQNIPEMDRVAVLGWERNQKMAPAHLRDLFPDSWAQADLSEADHDETQDQAKAGSTDSAEHLAQAMHYGKPFDSRPDDPQTLVEALQQAAARPGTKGITYIDSEGRESKQSYAQLLDDAACLLGGLRRQGLKPLDSVLFQFDSNQNFLTAFWACMLGGFLPTPVGLASDYTSNNDVVQKLYNSWRLLKKPVILTDAAMEDELNKLTKLWHPVELQILAVEPLMGEPDRNYNPCQGGNMALNLLTSGSTGKPKCVQHRHQSVLAFALSSSRYLEFSDEETIVNWMPLDHVGGIVMMHVFGTVLGCNQVHAKIDSFIGEPLKWMDWLTEYRATYSWAPNFAYGLVNEQKDRLKDGSWDLSRVKYILNGGEAVSPKTAQQFLEHLAPYGLEKSIMLPAYGMSETSSGCVFSRCFNAGGEHNGIVTIDKNSLSGTIQFADPHDSDSLSFTEVGETISGVMMRIVDSNGNLMRERQIGRLQIKGPVVMAGYYKNDEANAEVFVGDGWFNTGDLGFLHRGRLTLTGREKDVIIIHGKNHHNYEIEAFVEEVSGVRATFSAACAVPDPHSGSETLAIFFVPSDNSPEFQAQIIRQVRQQVIQKVGISPGFVIPVEEEDFPKSGSGKLQRGRLSKQLLDGGFDDKLKDIDIMLGNANTVPQWMYRMVPEEIALEANAITPLEGDRLIFADDMGLAETLKAAGEARTAMVRLAKDGLFARLDAGTYALPAHGCDAYKALMTALSEDGFEIRHVLHLWHVKPYAGEPSDLADLKARVMDPVKGLLDLVTVLGAAKQGIENLLLATTALEQVEDGAAVAYEKAPLKGILKTIPNELTNLRCLHIDLDAKDPVASHRAIEAELAHGTRPSVALRAETRFEPRLKHVSLFEDGQKPIKLREGGLVLMPGGMGGIGQFISKFLLDSYGAHVVCLGRNDLDSDRLADLDRLNQKAERGKVEFRALKLSDATALKTLIQSLQAETGKSLNGVIHLAGVLTRHLLTHQTDDLLESAFEAKVYGSYVLHQVLADYPEAFLINTSSAGTLTCDMMLGGYNAANTFVEALSAHRNQALMGQTKCLAWGAWDQTGMSLEMNMMRDILKRRGFMPIDAASGIHSLRRALMMDHANLVIGLDGRKAEIEPWLADAPEKEFALRVFFTTQSRLSIRELRQTTTTYLQETYSNEEHNLQFFPMVALPELSHGRIDREKLRVLGEEDQTGQEYEAPRTLIEGRLVPIWQDVLDVERVGIHDDFFGIGGHSLKAMQLVSAIRNELGFELSLTALFENPTVAKLATIIQHSQPAKAMTITEEDGAEDGTGTPMTYAQKQLWLAFQIDPDSPVYNNTMSFHLQGKLEIEVLKKSLRHIVARHEILRAQFEWVDDEVIQTIRENLELEIPVLDLSHLRESLRANKLISARRREARTPFNLKGDPMIRAMILRMTPDSHYLVVSIHHIIFDDWSASILMKEMISAYNALLHGNEPELPALESQYPDFARWQRHWFASGQLTPQLGFWKDHFAQGVPVLNLPTDHARPAMQTYHGRTREIRIDAHQVMSLRKLSRESDCTLYMTLLAAFATTLYRYSGQEEIVIGSVVAQRNQPQFQNLIGYFVNTLPILFNFAGKDGFETFLQQVRQQTLAGFDNQDVPFEMIIDRLRVQRDPSRPALCQALFTFQSLPVGEHQMEGVSVTMELEDNGTSKWDLSMYALEVGDEILITVEYNTDLFLDSSIERFLGHFRTLVAASVRNREQSLDTLAMVPGPERKDLLTRFNDTRRAYPIEFTMSEHFEKAVAQTPDKVAIVYNDQAMTYRDLNARANRVAHYLRTRGVAPDVVVGMMVERSHEMIIGILAILKAGGAYLPLSPKDPCDRIEYVARDSGMLVMLTQNRFMDHCNLSIETVDLEGTSFDQESPENLDNINADCDLAYVIYTSGSTGRPKGVMIEHASMVNILFALQEIYPLEENDAYLLKTSYTFDVSVVEIFGWILGDGKLVILEPDGEKDPQAILNAIKRYDITHINFVPSALHLFLLDTDQIRVMEKLKYIFVAGEAISHTLVNRLFDSLKSVRVENLYGPTEATIYATYHSLSKTEDVNVPIGRPIPNLLSFIVNQEGILQPINVAGELCIAGKGLARGYLNHPEMTADKFVRNPNVPNQIMYRTGDLARWRSDGNIEYLGRIDDQVKIRGFRIELGEIKAQLEAHDRVQKAVVIAQKDDRGQNFLAAYIVSDQPWEVAELRQHLGQKLPHYMIPAFFVPLDAVPLSPSGKLNRKALPAISGAKASAKAYRPASTPTEAGLVDIWQEVLGLERVGVDDNFFEVGGNSLSATMVTTRACKHFHVNYPLRELFGNPTIKQMAEYIATAEESIFDNIQPIENLDAYPASSAQKRVYVIDYFQTVTTAYNMPVVVPIEGRLEVARLQSALDSLVARHDAFRTAFDMQGKDVIQKIAAAVAMPIAMQHLGDLGIDETIENFIQPFDLKQAPLARAALVKLFEDNHLLLIDMHHAVTDGVSLGILLEELWRIYNGEELPALDLQYKDYSHWQHKMMARDALRNEREYWISHFADEVPVLDWATDYPRPALQQYEGDRVKFMLSSERTQDLLNFNNEQGVTLYMSLLAAYFIMLSKYVNQEDIVVGSPIAGRPHADLERIVGMFVNLLAIREKPRAELSVADFLGNLRETVLRGFENANYPFEEMVESLQIQRDLSRNPVFDVLFTLQNMAKPKLASDGLKISYYEYEENVAKFDLIAVASEVEDSLHFEFEYCSKIFKRETIVKMGEHYLQTLSAMIDQPNARLGELQLASQAERRLLLEGFNQTEMPRHGAQTLHGLFEEQAARHSERIALVMGDRQLTYREIQDQTDHLAMRLRQQGLQANQPAALLLERSLEMVIGMLAILKAGGAYLSIDPADPLSRKQYILEDSGIKHLLCRGPKEADLLFEGSVIDLDDLGPQGDPAAVYANHSLGEHMAYIIYTSGSTGKPKGVVLEHGGAVNTLTYLQRECPMEAGDTYLLKTSTSFDVSVTELFGWFFGDGRLAILEAGAEKDPAKIIAAIQTYGVTHLNYVPSALQVVLQDPQHLEGLKNLKYLMIAGEALPNNMIATLLRHLPEVHVENIYGPTEATIYATHYPIRQLEVGNVPIGRPVGNTKAIILDDADRLQLLNVPGELCIAGPGVARGYLGRDQLTAEKFIEHPLLPGQRLYRTGDLARWRPDGQIEFLGRIDSQVKVRGYRIELGEIKTQLEKHEAVREAHIAVRHDEQAQAYLTAYLIADQPWQTADLRRHLLSFLPTYMVPAFFHELKTFPKTASGKIDAKRLPEPNRQAQRESQHVAAVSAMESRMIEIWEEVLDLSDLGTTDNFFDLGGDSIKAIQIASRFNNEGMNVFINDILQKQNIQEICRFIQGREQSVSYQQTPLMGGHKPLPAASWFLEQALAEPGYFNQSFLFDLSEVPSLERLSDILTRLVHHHDELRINLVAGDLVYNDRHLNSKVTVTDIDLKNLDAAEQAIAIAEHCQNFKAFDLEKDCLLKALVLHTGPDRAKLLLTMHHLVTDGVSWRLFLENLMQLYRAAKSNQSMSLPAKTASLGQFYDYLEDYATSDQIMAERPYWDQAQALDFQLPSDMAGDDHRSLNKAEVVVALDQEHTQQLVRDAHQTYNTDIKDLLVTALSRALIEWTGRAKHWIEFEGHGRYASDLEVSRTIGWFTNLYPVVLDLPGDDVSGQIKAVKEQLRAVPNKGLGFGVLKHIRKAYASTHQRTPVRFNYLGRFDQELNNEWLTLSSLDHGPDMSPHNAMSADVEINCLIVDDQFRAHINFNQKTFHHQTMTRFGDDFIAELKGILDSIAHKADVEFTPSDFEAADMDQDDLDDLFG